MVFELGTCTHNTFMPKHFAVMPVLLHAYDTVHLGGCNKHVYPKCTVNHSKIYHYVHTKSFLRH